MRPKFNFGLILIISAFFLISGGCSSHRPKYNLKNKYSKPGNKELFKKMDAEIKSYLGAPYKYGGLSRSGLDCSGLVYKVYKNVTGITLPRQTKNMFRAGYPVNNGFWKYGDLLFFSTNGRGISHVGIYINDKKFAHVSKQNGTIISSLDDSYYAKRFKGVRRIIK